jgi:ABC-2 type transport system permease protein
MKLNKIIAVTKWEFIEKVKSKGFIISLILMPILMVALGVLPSLLASREDEKSKDFGLYDMSNLVGEQLKTELMTKYLISGNQPNYNVTLYDSYSFGNIDSLRKSADKLCLNSAFECYIVLYDDILETGNCEFRGTNVSNIRDVERVRASIKNVISVNVLQKKGIETDILNELNKPINLESIKVTESGEGKKSDFLMTFFTSYIFIILLMLLIMLTGQMLIRSMIEEKSNRIVEILVSSCSPQELMAGKIFGLSFLGLVQVALWVFIGICASISFNLDVVTLDNLLLILIYFVLGYLLYAAIFVSIGSVCSTEQEAQQLTGYVSILLVIPMVLAISVVQNPNSLLIQVLTYIPLLTPTFMIMRIPVVVPQWWEIVTNILLLVLSVWLLIWIAGKIFRTGILVYGKRPSIKELLRWIRAK